MNIDVSKADVGVAIGTATAIAGVLAHLKFDNSVTTALTATGVIATALSSYFKSRGAAKSARESEKSARDSARDVANIAATTSADNTAKTVLVQTVTAERAKWRAEMRDQAERLAALLRAHERGGPEADWEQVDRLRTGIRPAALRHLRVVTRMMPIAQCTTCSTPLRPQASQGQRRTPRWQTNSRSAWRSSSKASGTSQSAKRYRASLASGDAMPAGRRRRVDFTAVPRARAYWR